MTQLFCVNLPLTADLYVFLERNQTTEMFEFILVRDCQDSSKLQNTKDMHTASERQKVHVPKCYLCLLRRSKWWDNPGKSQAMCQHEWNDYGMWYTLFFMALLIKYMLQE